MSILGAGKFTFGENPQVEGTSAGVPQGPSEQSASDTSVLSFGKALGLKEELVMAVLTSLGGDATLTLEDFAFVEEDEFKNALGAATVGGNPLTTIARAQALRMLHSARTRGAAEGLPIPGVIQPPDRIEENKAKKEPEVEKTMLKQSAFLNQASEAREPPVGPKPDETRGTNFIKWVGLGTNAGVHRQPSHF